MKTNIYITNFLIFSLCFFLFQSCNQDKHSAIERSSDGTITGMDAIWQRQTSNSTSELNYGQFYEKISYGGNVVISRQNGDSFKFLLVSSEDGRSLWEWDDFYPEDGRLASTIRFQQIDNILYFGESNRLYGINLADGSTALKRKIDVKIRSFNCISSSLVIGGFRQVPGKEYASPIFIRYVPETNTFEDFIEIPQTFEVVNDLGRTGQIGAVKELPFSSLNSKEMAFTYGVLIEKFKVNTFLAIQNMVDGTSKFPPVPILTSSNFGTSGPDIIYDEKIFLSPVKTMKCFSTRDGSLIWERTFEESFTFSGFIIADNTLLANSEGAWLYAMDPNTGQQLWKEKSSGTSSKMVAMKGIVYFVGGGDGLLHAVEIATGKHIWKIQSPDLEKNSGAWFMPKVDVIPPRDGEEKGRIIVSSYIGAFAYEAVR